MPLHIKDLPSPKTPMELTAWQNFKSIRENLGQIVAGSGITVTNNGDGTITVSAGVGFVTGAGAAGRAAYWSGASALTSTANFLFTDTTGAGAASTLEIANPDGTNAASHAVNLLTAAASGGDPKSVYTVTGVRSFATGYDSSAAIFVISESTNLGTNNRLTINTAGTVSIPGAFSVTGNVSTGAAVFVGSSLSVATSSSLTGAVTMGSTLALTGIATLSSRVNINGAGDNASYALNVSSSSICATGTGSIASYGVSLPGNTNKEWGFIQHDGSNFRIVADKGGTGTYRPITLEAGGSVQVTISTGGNLTASGDVAVASGKVYKVNTVQVLAGQISGLGATLSSATAGGTYGGTEQTMLQEAHDKIRVLEGMLKTHGLVAT